MRIADLSGRRVAIWGMGREGRAALATLRAWLPDQVITVFCSETEASQLRGGKASGLMPVGSGFSRDASQATASGLKPSPTTQLGVPRVVPIAQSPDASALSAFDVIIKSPGISIYRDEIVEAQRRGTIFTSGTALWFAERPSQRVIAVTGTKGKSTTSALIAHLLRAIGQRVALAGNIGIPLLELLDVPAPDWWVVELSSFQTRDAGPLDIGVVINLAEEHLDWHHNRERYVADKLALASCARLLVVNATQPELMQLTAGHHDRRTFGYSGGWHVAEGVIYHGSVRKLAIAALPLPGAHNALNVCAALAALDAAGENADAALAHVADFRPLPHRLQTIGTRDGLTFVDDSIATTPQATLEAMASVSGRPTCVLIGGFDRGLDWAPFCMSMRQEPPVAIVTMGASGPRLAAQLDGALAGVPDLEMRHVDTLAEAIAVARMLLPAGGVVLLSPGAPSFDAFRDYAERGRTFAALAGFDGDTTGEIAGLGIA